SRRSKQAVSQPDRQVQVRLGKELVIAAERWFRWDDGRRPTINFLVGHQRLREGEQQRKQHKNAENHQNGIRPQVAKHRSVKESHEVLTFLVIYTAANEPELDEGKRGDDDSQRDGDRRAVAHAEGTPRNLEQVIDNRIRATPRPAG